MITEEVATFSSQAARAAALDELYGGYTAAVDAREWQRWPGFFTEECSYIVQSLENFEQGLPLAYMLDDNRARLLDRVKFVTEVWAGTIEPYRTRHFVQRVQMTDLGDGSLRVRASLLVSYTEAEGIAAILASGYYDDLVQITESGALFAERNVYLDGIPSRYLVYPL